MCTLGYCNPAPQGPTPVLGGTILGGMSGGKVLSEKATWVCNPTERGSVVHQVELGVMEFSIGTKPIAETPSNIFLT